MRNRVYVGTYVRMRHQLLNMKRSSEGGVGKTSIAHTITDTIMIVMYLLFERSEFLIHTPQKKNLYRLYGNKLLHVERVFY